MYADLSIFCICSFHDHTNLMLQDIPLVTNYCHQNAVRIDMSASNHLFFLSDSQFVHVSVCFFILCHLNFLLPVV